MASSGNKDASLGNTRRNFLSRAAASIAAASACADAVVQTKRAEQGDPVVSLWRDWMVAHRLVGKPAAGSKSSKRSCSTNLEVSPARESCSPKTVVSCGPIPAARSTVFCRTRIRIKRGGKQGPHWRSAGANGRRRTSGSDTPGRKSRGGNRRCRGGVGQGIVERGASICGRRRGEAAFAPGNGGSRLCPPGSAVAGASDDPCRSCADLRRSECDLSSRRPPHRRALNLVDISPLHP